MVNHVSFYCLNCRITFIDTEYCSECGRKLLELWRCGCGGELALGMKYCSDCGENVEKEVEEFSKCL